MTNLRKNREKSELGRIGNWDIKRVTEATEEYGGIYRDETIVCRSRFCNVLLNYWCCFRTQKCETKKNLCIIIVLIHHRELRSTFMAVWQLWDDLKRAQSSSKTGGGHIILLLLRFTKKKRWSSGRWKARQEWNLFLNSVCWFDQEKNLLKSVDPFSWMCFSVSIHRGTLFDLGDSCCSVPRCSPPPTVSDILHSNPLSK